MNQEQILQLQIMENEFNQLNQQFQLIEQNVTEMQELNESLEEIENGKEKEIFVNIGKKIFLPVKINNDKLILDVGSKKLIKKTISDTRELCEEQIKKLISAKTEIMEKLRDLESEMEVIFRRINEKAEKK